ncbi:MAG: hypothetical protein Q4D34_04255 [Eggerthellaceae bacterium]|nr:hypothetical protein [Eggerthellaceae bacterium]
MIRTNSVELNSMPAIAYRRKFPAGGSGIVIVRSDASQPGIASISKTSGEAIIAANTPTDLYPAEAFAEAIALTAGMPYRKQGKPKTPETKTIAETTIDETDAEAVQAEIEAEEVIVDGDDYQKIVDTYTDKTGKLFYDLINKDLIKFAHSSSVVREMLDAGDLEEDILLYAVGTKFRSITGDDKLDDNQVLKIVELLDAVSPKRVFKEFVGEIRSWLSASKAN